MGEKRDGENRARMDSRNRVRAPLAATDVSQDYYGCPVLIGLFCCFAGSPAQPSPPLQRT